MPVLTGEQLADLAPPPPTHTHTAIPDTTWDSAHDEQLNCSSFLTFNRTLIERGKAELLTKILQ